jgi:hypothetical protein
MMTIEQTYLYLKKHNQTGLTYFGKTVRNPESYTGSGVLRENAINV